MGFQTKPIINYIGQGMTFPLKLDNGRARIETGFELLKASIITILKWPYGTRFMLNQFGHQIDDLLEEPNDSQLDAVIEHYVKDALGWERRVELINIQILRPNSTSIHLSLRCRVKNTKDEFSFVFPFYDKIIY